MARTDPFVGEVFCHVYSVLVAQVLGLHLHRTFSEGLVDGFGRHQADHGFMRATIDSPVMASGAVFFVDGFASWFV